MAFLFFYTFYNAAAQDGYMSNYEDSLFASGIYFENLHFFLAWNANLDTVERCGKPLTKKFRKGSLSISWDSVQVMNGITAEVRYLAAKQIFHNRHSGIQAIVSFDSVNAKKAVTFIKKYYSDSVIGRERAWVINNREVDIFHRRRHPNLFHMVIFINTHTFYNRFKHSVQRYWR